MDIFLCVSFIFYQSPKILKIWQIELIIFSSIWAYSTASTSEAAYIIGGRYTGDIIAEFKNDSWRQIGTLARGYYAHGSIILENEVMIIGGNSYFSDKETEIWDVTNETNKVLNLTLPNERELSSGNYQMGIGLYIVPFNFCTT